MARLRLGLREKESSLSGVELAEVGNPSCTPWPFKAAAYVATPKIQTEEIRCLGGSVSEAGCLSCRLCVSMPMS